MIPATLLTDCLTNCHEDCVSSFEASSIAKGSKGLVYGRGIVNGMIAAVMVCKQLNFDQAITYVKNHVSEGHGLHGAFDARCIPEVYREAWDQA